MSSNAALVVCARGARNQVSSADEKQLEEIYTCFERLRVRPLAEKRASRPLGLQVPKALTLPEGLRDWFVNRSVEGLPQWFVASQADEQQLCRHVVALHRLGIPAFFREQLQPLIMKLFVSLEARVPSARIPADEAQRGEFWLALKDSLLRLVVPALAEVVLELFGRSSSLVVVLDASGWSPGAGHWKVSQRICFVDVAVSTDTARRVRGMLVRHLERACRAGGSAAGGLAAGLVEDWERAVDERAFQRGAAPRLAFCDVAHGSPPTQEERPLLPLALLQATAAGPGGPVDLQQATGAAAVPAEDWVDLGSTWTAKDTPTEFAGAGCASPAQWASTAPQVDDGGMVSAAGG